MKEVGGGFATAVAMNVSGSAVHERFKSALGIGLGKNKTIRERNASMALHWERVTS
jgi:hypothetical protein